MSMSGKTEVIEHITREGDRWDLLADEYYGDATAYEEIVAANASVPITPILESGIVLLIPVLAEPEAEPPGGLPPWKA